MIYRMHGTENKFYLIDRMGTKPTDLEMSEETKKLCQDGSDGVLYVMDSDKHLAMMRIFNSDGSEPEMCGNGLRCVARYVLEKFNEESAVIETIKAAYEVAVEDDFHGISGIRIRLYPVKHLAHKQLAGFETAFEFKYYNVSNPHIVAFTEQHLSEEILNKVGEYANLYFDEGMNVNFVRIIDANKIYVQTYERGVGITKSCGTGMTSSSVHYASLFDAIEEVIEVYNDGGMITCQVEQPDDYAVWFTGNATYMSEHEDDGRLIRTLDEQKQYEIFYNKTRDNL